MISYYPKTATIYTNRSTEEVSVFIVAKDVINKGLNITLIRSCDGTLAGFKIIDYNKKVKVKGTL